ncbi:hypothetical protein [Actinomadura soli]
MARQSPGFGNGRAVRHLLEIMETRLAHRFANDPTTDVNTFEASDIP